MPDPTFWMFVRVQPTRPSILGGCARDFGSRVLEIALAAGAFARFSILSVRRGVCKSGEQWFAVIDKWFRFVWHPGASRIKGRKPIHDQAPIGLAIIRWGQWQWAIILPARTHMLIAAMAIPTARFDPPPIRKARLHWHADRNCDRCDCGAVTAPGSEYGC